jgi:hypothetical protein
MSRSTYGLMFIGAKAEVGGLDSQCSIVGNEPCGGMAARAESRTDDAIVRDFRVEAVLDAKSK